MSARLIAISKVISILGALSILIYASVFVRKHYLSNTSTQTSPTDTSSQANVIGNVLDQTETNAQYPSEPSPLSQETALPNQDTTPQEPSSKSDVSSKTTSFIPQTVSSTDSNAHVYIPLSKISCEKNCGQFIKDVETRYCQEYCGFTQSSTIDTCSDLQDLEEDYCLKGQAIAKTDPALCKKITDDNIRIACQNRVLEDIVDKQQSQ